ncbi:MAG: hypothetical protein HFJ02_01410 [Bacilli bacterium]|nr:hypothetical protein [Bacilli bacterium]
MLHFFLYNHIFEYLIIAIATINYIFIAENEKNEVKKDFKQATKSDAITKYKITSILLTVLYLTAIAVCMAKEVILSIILIIVPSIALVKSLVDTYKNKINNSIDDNYTYTSATFFFIIFLSAYVTPLYFISFATIEHAIKEILLITYLILKIVLFTFLFTINLFILLSNITNKIKKNSKLNSKLQVKENQYYRLISYDFPLFRKYKNQLTKILDNIIFFILCPFTLIVNIICIFFLKIIKSIKIKLNKLLEFITKNINNKNIIIKKATNISIIISLVIVYIITITDSHLFSDNISQIYNFISTVILIPFIYDSIKSK